MTTLKAKKRPDGIRLFFIGVILGFPTGLLVSSLFPESSSARATAGWVGLLTPPIVLTVYSSKKWSEYVKAMLEQYEAAKEQLRQNPTSVQAREAMLLAGRAYYSCVREEGVPTIYDEQAISNDMKAILGS